MRECSGQGVHVGFGDEFNRNRNIEFPSSQRLVVGGCDEAAVFVDKGDGVDGLQMVVIFLGHSPRTGVVLHDFLVRHTCEELVGAGGIGLDDVRDTCCTDTRGAFASLRVPSVVELAGGIIEEILEGRLERTISRAGHRIH